MKTRYALAILAGLVTSALLAAFANKQLWEASSATVKQVIDRDGDLDWVVRVYRAGHAVMIAAPAVLIALAIAHRPLRPTHACRFCGYDLTGNTSGRCPECGTAV